MMNNDKTVFLFDVDNTLLENDIVIDDLGKHIEENFGAGGRERYFAICEKLRSENGYADYLGALQKFRMEKGSDPRLMLISTWLLDYPFSERLYPGALNVLDHVGKWGKTVILSDGDAVMQPHKVQRSGLWDAVEGRVLIYVHKERMLDEVEKYYPAPHYVVADDKLSILSSIKNSWGERVTTVFPRQGHYASDPTIIDAYPEADLAVEQIGDLLDFDISNFLLAGKGKTG